MDEDHEEFRDNVVPLFAKAEAPHLPNDAWETLLGGEAKLAEIAEECFALEVKAIALPYAILWEARELHLLDELAGQLFVAIDGLALVALSNALLKIYFSNVGAVNAHRRRDLGTLLVAAAVNDVPPAEFVQWAIMCGIEQGRRVVRVLNRWAKHAAN